MIFAQQQISALPDVPACSAGAFADALKALPFACWQPGRPGASARGRAQL